MTLYVRPAPKEHFAWMTQQTSWVPTGLFRAIEAIDDAGSIRGMVGFDSWTYNAVQMHIALTSPAVGRALLRPAFEYPFEQYGLGLVLGCIPEHRTRSVRLAKHLGFVETHRTREGWAPDVDLVHFEMRREQCRFLSHLRKAA